MFYTKLCIDGLDILSFYFSIFQRFLTKIVCLTIPWIIISFKNMILLDLMLNLFNCNWYVFTSRGSNTHIVKDFSTYTKYKNRLGWENIYILILPLQFFIIYVISFVITIWIEMVTYRVVYIEDMLATNNF